MFNQVALGSVHQYSAGRNLDLQNGTSWIIGNSSLLSLSMCPTLQEIYGAYEFIVSVSKWKRVVNNAKMRICGTIAGVIYHKIHLG